jgi:phosphate transport system substrate-binding protein
LREASRFGFSSVTFYRPGPTERGICDVAARNARLVAAISLSARVVALASLLAFTWGMRYHVALTTAPASPAPHPSATLLYGGGAALPTFALQGPADGDGHSVFGYFATVSRGYRVSYCPTGSGFGMAVFDGTIAANGPCTAGGAPTGFGAVAEAADFAVSDTPLSLRDARVFARNAATKANPVAGRGAPVQVPALAGTVAIVYRNGDVMGRLQLDLDTLCRIADGEIVNWNQIPLDPGNPAGAKYPSRRLRFVYRSDRDGLTFSLSNFLSARDLHGAPRVCLRRGETFGLNDVFDARDAAEGPQSPSGVLPAPLPAGASTENFLGAWGDHAEIDCVSGTGQRCRSLTSVETAADSADGTVGYTSGAAAAAATALRPALGVALIYAVQSGIPHAYDPVADLPAAATLLGAYATGMVLGDYRPNGRPAPTLVALPAPKAACVATIPPDRYAYPETGYPIVAVVNLEFTSAGNGRRAGALRGLATVADNSRELSSKRIRSVDRDAVLTGMTGYSVLPLNVNRKSGIPSLVASCIGP